MSKIFDLFSIQRLIVTLAIPAAIWILLLTLVQQSPAQPRNVWSSHGPNVNVYSVVVDPSSPTTIYAGTATGGVFKSINSGASWSAANQGLTNINIRCLAIDPANPNILYAGTEIGVFKTENGGANWNLTFSGFVTKLSIAAGSPSVIYAATYQGIFVTTNGGQTWNQRPSPDWLSGLSHLVVDPRNPNIVFVAFDFYKDFFSTIYKSTDGGASWTVFYYQTDTTGGLITLDLKIHPGNANILYASTYIGVFKSLNGGASWALRGSIGFPNRAAVLAIDPNNHSTLYAAGYYLENYTGVYKSTDSGATWNAFNNGLTNLQVHNLSFDSTGRFLHAATESGVFSMRVRDTAKADFNGDARTDVSVFRPSDGVWYLSQSVTGFSGTQFGLSTDKLVSADYDGDGKIDIAAYRPSEGTWYIANSSNSTFSSHTFGLADDVPLPADFDGDGKADLSVFRPSDGTWYRQNSSNGQFAAIQWGQSGDIPMLGDYDADGKIDFTVFRSSNGYWYIHRSSDNQFQFDAFGSNGDIPLNGDFSGDGSSDMAVFRPSNGTWYLARPTGIPGQNFDAVRFGLSTDIPTPGDYDGDGKTDVAVYREGAWYVIQSSNGSITYQHFGLSSDIPIASANTQ